MTSWWGSDVPVPGILFDTIPDILYTKINSEIKNIQKNFKTATAVNNTLVGHIKHEYELTNCFADVDNYLSLLIKQYDAGSQGYISSTSIIDTPTQPKLSSLWVNFQQKHEFNPPHDHSGLLSFVIWMKIPYNLSDEAVLFPNVRGTSNASKFGFLFHDSQGRINTKYLSVDKEWQGTIAIFPSTLTHWVNPFYTSDDFRITVSGNVKLANH